jgi:hypothetical protein
MRAERTGPGSLQTWPKPPENVIRVQVDAAIDLSELAKWSPETCAAFMKGIGAVLAAAGRAELDKKRAENGGSE